MSISAKNSTFGAFAEYLDSYLCTIVDFPPSRIDCSQRQPYMCFECPFSATYFSGERLSDYQSIGHTVCRVMGYTAILIAALGVITNWLIFIIIRKKRPGGQMPLDSLIVAMSHVDNLCCISCIGYCAAYVAIHDNLFGTGQVVLYWLYVSTIAVVLGRTMSMYLLLIICIDRYLAIAYPLQSNARYCRWKPRVQIGSLVLIFATQVITGIYFGLYVGPNIYDDRAGGLDVPSLKDFSYMFYPTRLTEREHPHLKPTVFALQYYIPVPALMIFNLLTYRQVTLLKKKRSELTSSQQKELQPAQMFIPVVIVFLLANIWPMIMLATTVVWNIFYRELWMLCVLATAVNSSIRFWIYYLQGTLFRTKTNALLKAFYSSLSLSRSNSNCDGQSGSSV